MIIQHPIIDKKEQNQTPRQTHFQLRLTEAKEWLLGSIAGLDEDPMTTEHVVEGWTVKDILGHIVSWNEEFRLEIDDILQRKHPS